MRKKVHLISILLFMFLHGFSQTINTTASNRIQGYHLTLSNDSNNLLDNIFINNPKKCHLPDGSTRFFFSISNRGDIRFKKYSLTVYHKSDKIFKSKLPDLKKGEEFQFAFNVKRKGVNTSDLKLKFKKKRIYRIYQYHGD